MTTKETYTVKCYVDHTRRDVVDTCGHKHRTLLGAVRCERRLLTHGFQPGTWSAKWHNSLIWANVANKPADEGEIFEARCTLDESER